MKIVKDKKVYDMGYSHYETIASLPVNWQFNSVGNPCNVVKELRRDVSSGEFYILLLTTDNGHNRDNYSVDPVTKEVAAKIAEDYVDYDTYIEFFGDPEGTDAGLARERDKALKDKKSAEAAKELWFSEYSKANKKIAELEKRIAELEAK